MHSMLSLRPIWRHFEKKYRRQDPLQLPLAGLPATPFRDQIRAIYFEHGLIAVLKGDNTASSNIPIDALAGVLENRSARTGKIVRADGGIGSSC